MKPLLLFFPLPFTSRAAAQTGPPTLDHPQPIRLELLNVPGQRVRRLHEGMLSTGIHPFRLEPGDLPGGTYLIRAAGRSTQTQVVTLVK